MNLEQLKQKLKPALHAYEIEGVTIYIHRPSQRDLPLCIDTESTIIYCAKDENGDSIFSSTDIDGRVNINTLDFQFVNSIYMAIMNLVAESKVDEVEKK
ncbi:hypothetical protein [Kosakonia radicincitans]|uniref:hypothetical protein n=1 Tax=Kosakonia radicincitans TaxID=283686 RepID=UPI0023678542|nr:hypothetical protein [Kosakonia radicincitans]MDD7993767.1 hypothetical protein [Kosakonia radicincitans]